MNKERLKKLERVSKDLLSNYIYQEVDEIENTFWIITVTWVKISSDLSYLDVYISCFKNKELLPKALAKHGYDFQKMLNKAIQIRKLPKIRFRYDGKWELSQEICEVIKEEISKNKIS